jgi:hypothetical protein
MFASVQGRRSKYSNTSRMNIHDASEIFIIHLLYSCGIQISNSKRNKMYLHLRTTIKRIIPKRL